MQFALREWVRVLGHEWVTTSPADLRDAGTATFASDRVIPAILRRIGGRPLEWDGAELPPYYDPHYKCDMEVLRFDSRLPSVKYQHVIDEMRAEVPMVPVICGHKPADPRTSFVNRSHLVPGVSERWLSDLVAPAA